jgi:hypothetical protein
MVGRGHENGGMRRRERRGTSMDGGREWWSTGREDV